MEVNFKKHKKISSSVKGIKVYTRITLYLVPYNNSIYTNIATSATVAACEAVAIFFPKSLDRKSGVRQTYLFIDLMTFNVKAKQNQFANL